MLFSRTTKWYPIQNAKLFGVPHIHIYEHIAEEGSSAKLEYWADTNCSSIAQKEEIIVMHHEGAAGVKSPISPLISSRIPLLF